MYDSLRHHMRLKPVTGSRDVNSLVVNLLHYEEQELGHVFDVELGQSGKAFGDVRVQWQGHAGYEKND